ncbi:MAG: hypothetical protein ACYTXE_27045 [Nostoc sp.]
MGNGEWGMGHWAWGNGTKKSYKLCSNWFPAWKMGTRVMALSAETMALSVETMALSVKTIAL